MGKGEKLLLRSNFSSYPQFLLPDIRFLCLNKDHIFLRDKRLFEITEVEITRVNCIFYAFVMAWVRAKGGFIRVSLVRKIIRNLFDKKNSWEKSEI